jgi:hypothetical protein
MSCFSRKTSGPGDEPIALVDHPGDPVRDPARRVGGEVPALEGEDLEVVGAAQPSRLGRRAHPGRVPADHHQPLGHRVLLVVGSCLGRRA